MIANLSGRVAVVTGAASGIGLALTERFVSEGMRVVLADIEEPRLAMEVNRLRASGADVTGVPTDVSDPASVQALADTAATSYGAVHLLCNNAGVDTGGRFVEVPLASWQWVLQVNVFGAIHGIRSFLPLLEQQDEAHIVNTASLAALAAGAPTMAPYVASKFALLGLSENLHAELSSTGSPVGISIVTPGPVKTNMHDSERNRPADVPSTDGNEERRQLMDQLITRTADTGLEASFVADLVVSAVHEGRFFVLPHPEKAVDAVRKRLRWIEHNEPPAPRRVGD